MLKFIKSISFLWAFGSAVGLAIGLAISARLGTGSSRDYYLPLFIFIEIFLGSLLMGVGQWMILRTKLKRSWGWIPATTIGLSLGLFIGFFVSDLFLYNLNGWVQLCIMSGISGIFTGILQWLALQRKWKGALKWTLVSTLSWSIGITATGFIFDSYLSRFEFGYLFAPILGLFIGTFVGIISGIFVESTLIQTNQRGAASLGHAS